jgi:hypothetical protein
MAFNSTTLIGANLSNVDTTPTQSVGTITQGFDVTMGAGEFIYLKGVASTVVGSTVIYDTYANTTVLTVAGSRGPVAVALAASVANTYGWYQIGGAAVIKAGTVLAGGNVYATATAGQVDDAVVAGDKIDGARLKTADGTPSAGLAIAELARPSMSANG